MSIFLTARWQHLILLNYEIDPRILGPLVPPGTELDDYEGRHFVSMVGFRFLNTKVIGLPVPGHRDFEEINLRFYVRHRAGGIWRRGVVFVKEIVPRAAIAFLARALYGENYVCLPTRHTISPPGELPTSIAYEWKFAGEWNRLSIEVDNEPRALEEVSMAEYILENYWGYTARSGGTMEYHVTHPKWRVREARTAELLSDVGKIYGEQFVESLSAAPVSAFLAEGSEISVHWGSRL